MQKSWIWFTISIIFLWIMTKTFLRFQKIKHNINIIRTGNIVTMIHRTSVQKKVFQHHLMTAEMNNGWKLGIDLWSDTCCAGLHAHIFEIHEGSTITVEGFSGDLGKLENLPLANVGYAYDTINGETFILQMNNSIYLGDYMDDSLCNPIQCNEAGVKMDLRAKNFSQMNQRHRHLHYQMV